MKKVFKYPVLQPGCTINLPEAFKVVFFGQQAGLENVWAEVAPENQTRKWKFLKVEITAFPKWNEITVVTKGSIFLGGTRENKPSIRYHIWFLEPVDVPQTEEVGYALSDTGEVIPVEDAVHVGMIFDNDEVKRVVTHVYRFK